MTFGTPLPAKLAGPPLNDRDAIADAVFRSFASIDQEDKDLLLSSVTQDVHTDIAGKVCNGADELITKVWNNVANRLDTIHYITNLRVSVDTETTGRASFTAMAVHCVKGKGYEPGPYKFTAGAIYNCDAVKEEDGIWKLKQMKSSHVWADGDPSIMAPPKTE